MISKVAFGASFIYGVGILMALTQNLQNEEISLQSIIKNNKEVESATRKFYNSPTPDKLYNLSTTDKLPNPVIILNSSKIYKLSNSSPTDKLSNVSITAKLSNSTTVNKLSANPSINDKLSKASTTNKISNSAMSNIIENKNLEPTTNNEYLTSENNNIVTTETHKPINNIKENTKNNLRSSKKELNTEIYNISSNKNDSYNYQNYLNVMENYTEEFNSKEDRNGSVFDFLHSPSSFLEMLNAARTYIIDDPFNMFSTDRNVKLNKRSDRNVKLTKRTKPIKEEPHISRKDSHIKTRKISKKSNFKPKSSINSIHKSINDTKIQEMRKPKEIYEEIREALHVDTSIDDIDSDIHKDTEYGNQFLDSKNKADLDNQRKDKPKNILGDNQISDSDADYSTFFSFRKVKQNANEANDELSTTHFDYNQILSFQAQRMLEVMNSSVDPCNDFYEYACGRWNDVYPMADKAVDNMYDRLREGLDQVMRMLLENSIKKEDTKSTKLAKTLYRGCMKTDNIESLGNKPLLNLLNDLGGWPVLEGKHWNDSGFDWLEQIAKLRLLNNDILLSEWVAADVTNSSRHIIQIDQPDLGLPSREYYLNREDHIYRDAYLRLMLNASKMLGSDTITAIRDMVHTLDFETQLAKILTPSEERKDLSALHKRFTIDKLQEEVPEINWKKYMMTVTGEYSEFTDELIVYSLDYIKRLVVLIEHTEKRTLSNYILWRFIKNRMSNLGQSYFQAKQDFIKVLFGSKSQPERWLSCVSYVNGNLGYVVGSLFVQNYYPKSSKNDSEEMIQLIKESFSDTLRNSEWMEEKTKKIAMEKVDSMVRNVGYPEYIINTQYMDSLYSELEFNENEHFLNVIKMLRFHAKFNHKKLRMPVSREEWTTTPTVVNAYYSRSKNMIMFPAGLLQPPFYHPYFPKCLNFGGVGVVIGHEINHGFDDRGRQFDTYGNLHQWWTPSDIKNFYDKATCMLTQYRKYKVSSVNLHVNSLNTLTENIADNVGVKISYKAYQKWKSLHKMEEKVPGISLTNDQLFFLNFGQIWCEVSSPEAILSKIRGGQHAPNKYRVIGTLSNSVEFSKAYNCPVGSPMNPVNKCSVW